MNAAAALRQGLQVLLALAASDEPRQAQSIRAELNLPKSTTYDLLAALCEVGLVTHDREARTFRLGHGVLKLIAAYLLHNPDVFPQAHRPHGTRS